MDKSDQFWMVLLLAVCSGSATWLYCHSQNVWQAHLDRAAAQSVRADERAVARKIRDARSGRPAQRIVKLP